MVPLYKPPFTIIEQDTRNAKWVDSNIGKVKHSKAFVEKKVVISIHFIAVKNINDSII